MKVLHAFPATAVQLEKDEIFDINATDKKGFAGDYLLTYEDGTRGLLTNAEAHAQLVDPEKGHIEDNSHVVSADEVRKNEKLKLLHGQVILLPYKRAIGEDEVEFVTGTPDEVITEKPAE